MTNVTISTQPNIAALSTGDKVSVWDVSAGIMGHATVSQIRGSGAATDIQNTFTVGQIIQPTSTGQNGLDLYMPASVTGAALIARYNGASRASIATLEAETYLSLASADFGDNIKGPYVTIGRNTNGTKPGAGFLVMVNRAGSAYRVWVDASGNVRTGVNVVNYDNDGAGTVVGTQTSALAAKNILGEVEGAEVALRHLLDAAQTGLKKFSYKSGAFNGQEFEGIITDLAPRYGMDRDAKHPAGKSLNEIQLFSDLIQAVALLAKAIGVA